MHRRHALGQALFRSLRRNARLGSDRGSLPLAFLVIIVATGLAGILLASTSAKIAKTQFARDYALTQQAADAAVNDALMWTNSGRPTTWGHLTPPTDTTDRARCNTGTVNNVTWAWSIDTVDADTYTLTVRTTNDTAWVGCSPATDTGSVRRTFTLTLTAAAIQNADAATGKPIYRAALADGAGFTAGFFATDTLTLSPGTTVASTQTGVPARISTDGTINLGSGVTVPRITLYNAAQQPAPDRCVGAGCAEATITYDPLNYLITDDAVHARCTAATHPWLASRDHTLTDGACYTSLTFDTDYSQANAAPLAIYVTGDVSVAPGVKVNPTNPATLRIYSAGTAVTIDGGASSVVHWALAAPNATCAGGTAGPVTVQGALLCRTLTATAQDPNTGAPRAWTLTYDTTLRGTIAAGATYVWSIAGYTER